MSPVSAALRRALDLVLPPRCPACGTEVTQDTGLCPDCWARIDFFGGPMCSACGLPFDFDHGDGVLCLSCARETPAFDRARSVFRYDDHTRSMIIGFKHADRTHLAPAFASWMARAGAELLADADVIVPVPLHWRRLFERRYNQAALLAQRLGRDTGLPMDNRSLARVRNTPSQGNLSRSGRLRNLSGALAVSGSEVKGRHVLLIDDVMTTGATVSACARTLRRAGALRVDVLTLARVVTTEG